MSIAKHLFISGLIVILFSSCKNKIIQDVTSAENIVNTDSLASNQITAKYPIWILEFQKLRQALYQNDIAEIKTFFDFPFSNEQAEGLKNAALFGVMIDKYPTFAIKSEKDFEFHYQKIFPTDFIKSMLPIKSDSLLSNNFASSTEWKRPKDETIYSTTITYEISEQSLSIILNATYGKGDEQTESAVVYFFKLNKNNQLKFDKVVMAG